MATINNNGSVEEFDVEDDNQDVDSTDVDDETLDDDVQDDDDQDDDVSDDSDSDDSDDDDSDDKTDKPKFEKRYTQLKGDTPEEYAKSLEDAYNNSSAEAVRKNKELNDLKEKAGAILAAAEKNPELAKQLGLEKTETGTTKPDTQKSAAETYAEQMMNDQMEKDYADFTKAHPEVDTDENIQKELLKEVGIQSAAFNAATGKIISMKDAMNRAWKVLGYDDNSKEDLAVKSKEVASQGKTQGVAKKGNGTKKPEVSDAALAMAAKMGLSEKDVKKFYKP